MPDALPMITSRMHIELVAANLLDNAVSHGVAPGTVDVELSRIDGRVELRVTNACTEKETRTGFFQPFWRSDPARSSGRHFGLGLALCDRIVRLLGGSIDVHQETERFAVIVEFATDRST